MDIQLINFRGSAFCQYRLYNCKDAFPMFSAKLHTGSIYHFTSDYACGSWAAVNCIGGKGTIDSMSMIKINENVVTSKEIYHLSGWIAEKRKLKYGSFTKKSARQLIDDALNNSAIHKSMDEIKDIFSLTDRINRPLNQCSGEIFLISMAIQYAKGKKILCFPWISEFEMNRQILCKQTVFLHCYCL